MYDGDDTQWNPYLFDAIQLDTKIRRLQRVQKIAKWAAIASLLLTAMMIRH